MSPYTEECELCPTVPWQFFVGFIVYLLFVNLILKLSEAHEANKEYTGTKADALTTLTVLITNFQIIGVIVNVPSIRVRMPHFVLNMKLGFDIFFDLDVFQMMTNQDCLQPDLDWKVNWLLNFAPILCGLVFFAAVGTFGRFWPASAATIEAEKKGTGDPRNPEPYLYP